MSICMSCGYTHDCRGIEKLKADLTQSRADLAREREQHENFKAHEQKLMDEIKTEHKKLYRETQRLQCDLARAREALKNIADRVNNEGDDSQSCVSDVGHMARTALYPAPTWLDEQLAKAEKRGEARGRRAYIEAALEFESYGRFDCKNFAQWLHAKAKEPKP